jgi:uncharacterized protein
MISEPIIDFHVHLFPDRLFDAIWAYFSTGYGWQIRYRYYTPRCIEHLFEHGIRPFVYSNYAHRPGIAAELNRWNLELLERTPDVYCFAAYHPGDDDALAMAKSLLDHPRVLGFKLQLLVQDFYPDDSRLFPLYELVIATHKRLLFHAGTGPVASPYVGYDHFSRLMARYPDLPAIVAHMGGYEFIPFFGLLDRHPELYLDTTFSFYEGTPYMFNLSVDYLESYQDRLLYGSDFPNLLYPWDDEIKTLRKLNLSAGCRRKIFFENALTLIGRHAPRALPTTVGFGS